jgi:hypothetical protein
MPKVFVKPARGPDGEALVVRNPLTMRPIPQEGMELELDRTIRRRIADGDLVEVKNAAGPGGASSPAPPADEERS